MTPWDSLVQRFAGVNQRLAGVNLWENENRSALPPRACFLHVRGKLISHYATILRVTLANSSLSVTIEVSHLPMHLPPRPPPQLDISETLIR